MSYEDSAGKFGEKYFDFNDVSSDYSDKSEKNILTTLSSISLTTSRSTTACHARGLVAAYSRKLSATLGGSTSTRPWVRKLILKTYNFIDISNATIPITLGGSTTTSPPIVIVILRQQLDYVIVNYVAPTTSDPIKAKFSSSMSQLLFTFATPDTRGLRHEQSSCISLTSKKIVKALVASWRSLSITCQFSLQSHEARLTIGKAKILGVRLTKRLSNYLEIQMRQTHHITSDLSSWSSREVHQANERVLRTSNNIAQKISIFYFTYYIIITRCKMQYFFERQSISQLFIFSAGDEFPWVVQLESMPGYK
jgi:hypothetical protein